MSQESGRADFDDFISHVLHAFNVGVSKFTGNCQSVKQIDVMSNT